MTIFEFRMKTFSSSSVEASRECGLSGLHRCPPHLCLLPEERTDVLAAWLFGGVA
jgi:hypothetical protein